ncbi:MAG: hypothetical protein H0T53_08015 [Herpetosiphonaceae bacterium]|nr:hypothetical protein [Herpetosiphonaceae bacterium]
MPNHAMDATIVEQLTSVLEDLEQDHALLDQERFIERAQALDEIDFQLIHGLPPLMAGSDSRSALLTALLERARRLQTSLERIDQELIAELRAGIRSAAFSRAELAQRIQRYAGTDSARSGGLISYAYVDDFVNALLGFTSSEIEAEVARKPDMVFFQATPVRYILDMIARAQISDRDVFFDLGCGLGRVLVLVALLTGAASVGVEVEPAYGGYAQLCAEELGITTIQIQNTDARVATYTDGSVFFMYHPFTGEILEQVLQRLRAHAEGRRIRLCTLGRCTLTVARQDWLELIGPGECNAFQLAVFVSKEGLEVRG